MTELKQGNRAQLPKAPTGIHGLDEITGGGLPKGRPTLVCGGAGCGKTLLAMEFLVRGATEYDEPGVFITFEESTEDLILNVASLGFDLNDLIARKKILLDFVYVDTSEITETGEYDLEGLFIRLGCAIHNIGAKRVVLDTIESLFAGFSNPLILRAELRRLFKWLKDKGVTAVITGERGDKTLTRQGLEEYVSDCVLSLDHRVVAQDSTRRIRIVKYRGSTHGTNEYPFLIDDDGISILPITSLSLQHMVSNERISSGIPRLDAMLGNGEGFFRGSSVLISGTAGTGKSSISAEFTNAACSRGERVVYFAFEESPSQIVRNMSSIGINLQQWVDKGLLKFSANRPSFSGLETHLTTMHKEINNFKPSCVVVDPLSSLLIEGKDTEVKSMLMRLVDFLKVNLITGLFTNLTEGGAAMERTNVEISSLIDTWLLLRNIEMNGERNRGLYILKSRGMSHSNQIREFILTKQGVELRDVYLSSDGVLTGSARREQEAREEIAKIEHQQEIEFKKRELVNSRTLLDAKIAALNADFAMQEASVLRVIEQEKAKTEKLLQSRLSIMKDRSSDDDTDKKLNEGDSLEQNT
jgi:circadian clock protein KaiC